jgi:O-6-methylguanine DNA methyltransferase
MIRWDSFRIGEITVGAAASSRGLAHLSLNMEEETFLAALARAHPGEECRRDPTDAFLEAARAEMEEYFDRRRTLFDIALDLRGTAFEKRVWEALREIPYGRTCSYGELAASLGTPGAVRAVGAANGRNPVAVIVPCHRVIGADGSLRGYGGGLALKEKLLRLEGARPEARSGPAQLPLALGAQ